MTREEAQETIRTRELARLGALFAGFAHEIRNPLSTIGLNLQLVKEDFSEAESPAEKRSLRRLTVIESEVKRLQVILDEFLGYVRVPELDPQEGDLNELLEEIVDFVRPEMAAKRVSLRFFGSPAVGMVPIDQDSMRAVIVNLLRNAQDACEAGDEVMVSLRRKGDEVVIQITDTGQGMSAELVGKVFTPYFSTKKAGTGLGLPTARRIVELHRGRLELDSDPDKGTQFSIRLPVDKASSGPAPEETRDNDDGEDS